MKDPFSKRGPRLKPLQVPGFPAPIEVGPDGLTIGRSDDNDVCLPGDSFPSVSTHHTRIERSGDKLTVVDLGSTNGTLVNGERIERVALDAGDIVQLGPIGPRFLMMTASSLAETMFVNPAKAGIDTEPKLSETTVRQIVKHRSRRTQMIAGVAGVVVIGALVLWGLDLSREGRAEQERLQKELDENRGASVERLQEALDRITELQDQERVRETAWSSAEDDRRRRAGELEAFVASLKTNSDTLQERLNGLEENDAGAAQIAQLRTELEATRAQLTEARKRFEMIDPVNAEQTRLSDVGRVREAVVLLETTITLEDTKTGDILHDGPGGANFDDIGVPWTIESTGSGFTISPEGYIVTNAHVVSTPSDHAVLIATQGMPIQPSIQIEAVFSGTDRRLAAEVIEVAQDGVDLALIKIEPFDGMPHLTDFEVAVEIPEAGSDVFLFGFPLGNFAIQEGDTVIASTFRGILSRVVDGKLQVDAGVHPGNSGGPITDALGRVIGVVYSVQALPGGEAVYTIGYGIPIAAVGGLWPRKPKVLAEGGSADGDEGRALEARSEKE